MLVTYATARMKAHVLQPKPGFDRQRHNPSANPTGRKEDLILARLISKWRALSVTLMLAGLLRSPTTAQPAITSPAITSEERQAATAPRQETTQEANRDAESVLAVITKSRSTNTRGYIVTIHNDGSATAEIEGATVAGQAQPPRSQQFPAAAIDTKTLRSLLTEIGDVSKIPTGGCAKPVSFATRTEITYAVKTSGDLQCIRAEASDGQQLALHAYEDLGKFVQTTLGQLKINNRRLQFVRPPQPSSPQ